MLSYFIGYAIMFTLTLFTFYLMNNKLKVKYILASAVIALSTWIGVLMMAVITVMIIGMAIYEKFEHVFNMDILSKK